MSKQGWLPHNRHPITDVVSLVDASVRQTFRRPQWSNDTERCVHCGDVFLAESAPDGYPGYCTQVCVNDARKVAL